MFKQHSAPVVVKEGAPGEGGNSSTGGGVVVVTTPAVITVGRSSSSDSSRGGAGIGAFELQPAVIQRLGREIQELITSPPEGITFVPNDLETLAEIHADITGPAGTPYEGGTFRMRLVLSSSHPQSPPRAYFLTKIFHPNIASNGDICVNMLKRDWSPDLKLSDALMVIRCLLIVPFPESSLNDEAAKLFMESYEEYARRAKLMTTVHATGASDGKIPATVGSASYTASGGSNSKSANSSATTSTPPPVSSDTPSSGPPSKENQRTQPQRQQRDRNKETRKKSLKRL